MTKKSEKESFYKIFKKERESKNITFSEINEKTKMSIKYLEAIENGDFDILPNAYIRLFLKSYATFLDLDEKYILDEYEKRYPQVILQKSKDIRKLELNNDINEKTILKKERKKNSFYNSNNYFLKTSKIASFFLTFVFILGLYLLISYISNTQQNNILTDDYNNKNITELNIINDSLLSEQYFNKNKFLKNFNKKLRYDFSTPFIFQITTNARTKINISYDNENNERITYCNIIAPKDTLIKFDNKNNIYFDLWRPKDIQLSINNYSMSKFLGKEDNLIRGYFKPTNKELYLEFYSQ